MPATGDRRRQGRPQATVTRDRLRRPLTPLMRDDQAGQGRPQGGTCAPERSGGPLRGRRGVARIIEQLTAGGGGLLASSALPARHLNPSAQPTPSSKLQRGPAELVAERSPTSP